MLESNKDRVDLISPLRLVEAIESFQTGTTTIVRFVFEKFILDAVWSLEGSDYCR